VYPRTISEPSLELTDDVDGNMNICVQNYFNRRGVRVTKDRSVTHVEQAAAAFASNAPLRFVYVPAGGNSSQLVQLMKLSGDHFWVGDADELHRRAARMLPDPVYLLWQERYRDDPQVEIWSRSASLSESKGVTVARLSLAAFNAGFAEWAAIREQRLESTLDGLIAAAHGDPLLPWAIAADYAWTKDAYPRLYSKIRAQLSTPSAAALQQLAPGIGLYGLRIIARDEGSYRLYFFFRTDVSLNEDLSVLVHVIPPPESVGKLPPARQVYKYDDWSFLPDPPTSRWTPGSLTVVSTTVLTGLDRAAFRVGLRSSTRGTVGIVDFPSRPFSLK
jgi:hypothetical protein